MPHYHLSLVTDQPVAIKTRITAKGISNDFAGSGSNSGEEKELRDATAVTVDELYGMVQLLQIQMENMGKNMETVLKLSQDQKMKMDAPSGAQSFWRRLGIFLRLGSRRHELKGPEQPKPN